MAAKNSIHEAPLPRILKVTLIQLSLKQPFREIEFRISGKETSLNEIFKNNSQLWEEAFPNHSQKEYSLSAFRKAFNKWAPSLKIYKKKELYILYLKFEGKRVEKNPNATPLEIIFKRTFLGPLVLAMTNVEPPYTFCDFSIKDIEHIKAFNLQNRPTVLKQLDGANTNYMIDCSDYIHDPSVCITVKEVDACKNNWNPVDFHIFRYKTALCPIQKKHDRDECIYAHNFNDFRRAPDKFSYIPDPCVKKENCEKGKNCDKCHSIVERLYHPLKYRTNQCNKMDYCKLKEHCAFYHKDLENRSSQLNIPNNHYSRGPSPYQNTTNNYIQNFPSQNIPIRSNAFQNMTPNNNYSIEQRYSDPQIGNNSQYTRTLINQPQFNNQTFLANQFTSPPPGLENLHSQTVLEEEKVPSHYRNGGVHVYQHPSYGLNLKEAFFANKGQTIIQCSTDKKAGFPKKSVTPTGDYPTSNYQVPKQYLRGSMPSGHYTLDPNILNQPCKSDSYKIEEPGYDVPTLSDLTEDEITSTIREKNNFEFTLLYDQYQRSKNNTLLQPNQADMAQFQGMRSTTLHGKKQFSSFHSNFSNQSWNDQEQSDSPLGVGGQLARSYDGNFEYKVMLPVMDQMPSGYFYNDVDLYKNQAQEKRISSTVLAITKEDES